MKLKVRDLLESVPALQFLNDLPLPMRVSFRLAQVTRRVDYHLESYNSARLKKVNDYSEKLKEAGNKPTEETETLRKSIEKEIEELQQEEVELPDLTLAVADLDGQNIPTKHVVPLHWLIVETAAPPTPAPAAN